MDAEPLGSLLGTSPNKSLSVSTVYLVMFVELLQNNYDTKKPGV